MTEKEAWEELSTLKYNSFYGGICNELFNLWGWNQIGGGTFSSMSAKIRKFIYANRRMGFLPPVGATPEYCTLIRQAFCRRMAEECK